MQLSDLKLPMVSLTILDAHIAAIKEQEDELIRRGKGNAVNYRGMRLQLEVVREDILNHETFSHETNLFAHLDEQMARVLCFIDGMDPDFVGSKGEPNWKMFTQAERKKTWMAMGEAQGRDHARRVLDNY